MISIIIPVYNTERYLSKCIESILNQDYQDFEIIAVNDGSTDQSLDTLKEYANKDSRIHIIDKENEGQGIARNIAIEHARGEYILCIDSDDWLPTGSLSAMMEKAKITDADIIVGNSAVTFLDSEEIRTYNNEKMIGVLQGQELMNNIFNISPSACYKLIRLNLIVDNQIKYPSIFFEDLAIMPVLYALSKRIAFVDKCVYVQRMNSGSTVHRFENIYDRINFVEYLIEGLKKIGKYDFVKTQLDEYLIKRAQINMRMVKGIANKLYLDFVNNQQRVWKENYGINTLTKKKAYCFGSYNLMIMTKIFMRLEDSAIVEDYFGGSSLISCMGDENEQLNKISAVHTSDFRRKMLVNDFGRTFMNMNPGRFCDYEFFFVDFLEERYDIGVYNDEYFTISQAFEDVQNDLVPDFEVITAFSDSWWVLWKDACKRFVDKLKLMVCDKKIVLVKSYLSEKFYDDDKEQLFPEVNKIRDINNELAKCYMYFQQLCPSAIGIDICEEADYRTDYHFRHGCYPWHLSDCAYRLISNKIEDCITNLN